MSYGPGSLGMYERVRERMQIQGEGLWGRALGTLTLER